MINYFDLVNLVIINLTRIDLMARQSLPALKFIKLNALNNESQFDLLNNSTSVIFTLFFHDFIHGINVYHYRNAK